MDGDDTQNRYQIGNGHRGSIKCLLATVENWFMTHTILSSPNGAHLHGSTGTGNLLFLYQKPGPPPRAFPGRSTILAFPFVSRRPTSLGLG